MGDGLKVFGISVLVLFALIVLGAIANAAGFLQFAFFAPKVAAVQNKVFQQSQQYNEGMVRDLELIRRQYMAATPDQKDALRAIAIHRFEVYPIEQLPPDLQVFYRSLNP